MMQLWSLSESPLYRAMSEELRSVFERFDREVTQFTGAACLSCPLGCGDCCDHANPEVTLAEAENIERYVRAEAPELIDHIRSATSDIGRESCVFYDPDRDFHCMVYPARPLICRAFGYSAYSDRSGNKLFAVCPSMPISEKTGPVMQVLFEPFPPVMEHYVEEIKRLNLKRFGSNRKRPLSEAMTLAFSATADNS